MYGRERKIDFEKHRDYIPTAPSICKCRGVRVARLLLTKCLPAAVEVRESAQKQLAAIFDKNLLKDRVGLMLFLEQINNE